MSSPYCVMRRRTIVFERSLDGVWRFFATSMLLTKTLKRSIIKPRKCIKIVEWNNVQDAKWANPSRMSNSVPHAIPYGTAAGSVKSKIGKVVTRQCAKGWLICKSMQPLLLLTSALGASCPWFGLCALLYHLVLPDIPEKSYWVCHSGTWKLNHIVGAWNLIKRDNTGLLRMSRNFSNWNVWEEIMYGNVQKYVS